MNKHIRYPALALLLLSGAALGGTLPLVDSAFLRGGSHADTPQAWSSALTLKNASGDFCRIAMMKADISSATQVVDSATFTVYAKNAVPHTIQVYGVRDSAGFQDWTGGDSGTATWNSVATNGLFQPLEDLYLTGHSNLVLLGSQAMSGTNTGDVQVAFSGSELVNLLNTDTDGLLTFVFTTAANLNGIAIRPHSNTPQPTFKATYSTAVIAETTGPTGIKHPGCLQSAAEINALATALAENDPYRNQLWIDMMNNTRGRIDSDNWIPPTDLFGINFASSAKYAGAGLIRYINDWIINGSTTSEAHAITILNTWAGVQSFTPDPDDGLGHHRLVSMWLGYLAHAADLLISSNTSWPVAEQQAFKDTVRNILLPIANDNRAAGFNGNWDAGATFAVMAMAVLLDDKALFDEQIAWLKEGHTNARIANYLLANGQCQESSRDQGHANMGLTFLSLCVQTAWTQGIDLYEYDNRSIGKCFEYNAAYNMGEDHLPYQVYPSAVGTSTHGFNLTISADGRPTYFDVYEMVYHHYKNYRGVELPYSKAMLENHTRPEEPGGNWSNHNTLYWNLVVGNATNLGADVSLAVNPDYAGRVFLRADCGSDRHYMASDGRCFVREHTRIKWHDGGSSGSHTNPITGSADDGLYQTFRVGDCSYSFALSNGSYRVKLHFAEPTETQAGQRTFNVYIDGLQVLGAYDIFSEAGGKYTAHVHEISIDVTDGQLDVELEGVQGDPIISAIELEPDQGNYDSDGDGLTDAQEIALGTNPNDPDSAFNITGTTPLPMAGKMQFTWPSATGVLYRVWESPDLTNWTVVRDWTNAAAFPEELLEISTDYSNRFFKVEADVQ
ncbi:hypothetical protein PDESU_04015 [Pontiella desulfatans]|uniref:Alginate lyase domain-containing protein n=1 Tax=Pontiella desulfatans TaxID=2750659 RepID=A0A6C2U5S9_PONDE|nr:malectin domain-containing carbohydrate-binding protein [Pontiella desulfatans]VGO15432.1 hypothetical protein PDESU_04015 [Pontiella desulfatans]